MKKFLFALVLACLLAITADAQQTVTPNIQLQVPAYQQTNWQVPIDYDLSALDALLGGAPILPTGTTPSITQAGVWITANTSATVISNFVGTSNGAFTGQTIRLICGVGDTFTSVANSLTISVLSTWTCSSSSPSLTLTYTGTTWQETARAGATGGGGGFTAGLDLSGTSTNQQVIGILSHTLPSLAVGFLNWTGSAWQFSSAGGGSYPPIGVPNSSGSSWNASYTAPTGNLVGTGQANTFTAGLQNFGAATLELPSIISYAPTTAGLFGYDLTNNRLALGNGTNTSYPTWIISPPTSGHLVQFSGAMGLVIDGGAYPTFASLLGCGSVTAGTIIYNNGTSWQCLAGNTTTTQFLGESSSGIPSWQTPSGAGNVTGPGSSTVNDVAAFNNTGGTLLQDTSILYTNLTTQTSNGAANQVCTYTAANKICVPGIVPAGAGGTGVNSSSSTGIAQVVSGTWSFSVALPNGTTATTQSFGDSSTDVATDAFVLANAGSVPLTTLGDTLYENATPTPTRLPGNTSATMGAYTQTGTGTASAAPAWTLYAGGGVSPLAGTLTSPQPGQVMTFVGGVLVNSYSGISVNPQTGGYTLNCSTGDRFDEIEFQISAASTLSIPQAGNSTCTQSNFGFVARNASISTAVLTVTATTSVFLPENTNSKSLLPGEAIFVYSDATTSTGNYHAIVVHSSQGGTVTYTASTGPNAGDSGKLVIMNCTSACAYTIGPQFTNNSWHINLMSVGSTLAAVTLAGSDTFNGGSAPTLITKVEQDIEQDSVTSTNFYGGVGSGNPVFPLTVSGTVNNGGIPCFNSATNEESSVTLAANALIYGGGPGGCPSAVEGLSLYSGIGQGLQLGQNISGLQGIINFTPGVGAANIIFGLGSGTYSTSYSLLLPLANPSTGQVLAYANPMTWVTPALLSGNTFTGLQNLSGATLEIPTGAGFTSTASSMLGYDSTNLNDHILSNAVDSLLMVIPASMSIANHDCVEFEKTGSYINLEDTGSACSGSALSGMTASQIPVAATSSTVTSSIPLLGTDTNIPTGASMSASQPVACSDANSGVTTLNCMGLQMYTFSTTTTATPSGTQNYPYSGGEPGIPAGNASQAVGVTTRAGTVTALYVHMSTAETGTSYAVTVFHNGSATSMTCSITTTASCNDTASGHAFTFSAGDTLGYQSVQTGTGTSASYSLGIAVD
jgi:hypothetical protein